MNVPSILFCIKKRGEKKDNNIILLCQIFFVSPLELATKDGDEGVRVLENDQKILATKSKHQRTDVPAGRRRSGLQFGRRMRSGAVQTDVVPAKVSSPNQRSSKGFSGFCLSAASILWVNRTERHWQNMRKWPHERGLGQEAGLTSCLTGNMAEKKAWNAELLRHEPSGCQNLALAASLNPPSPAARDLIADVTLLVKWT